MVASSAGTPHVAIVGGGIGGVAAAAFLQRAGMPAIEHAAELKEVGAGLVLAPNAVRLLRRLGVMDKLLDRAARAGGVTPGEAGGTDRPTRPRGRNATLSSPAGRVTRSVVPCPAWARHLDRSAERVDTVGEADESRNRGSGRPRRAIVADRKLQDTADDTATCTTEAWACLAAFVSASDTT